MDMERLTEKLEEHGSYYYPHCFESGCDETSGLCICEDCSFQNKVCQKLGEYEDLEEQGKLLKLPCAVGETVWYISERIEKLGRKKVEVSFVDEGIVDSITLGCMMIPQINVCNDENVWTTFDGIEDLGKTVFITKEAAEAALKEMSG